MSDASLYLIELDAHTGSGVETLYLSSGRFVTKPSDTPANKHYKPVISDPGFLRVELFGANSTMGASEVAYGEARVINANADLDGWLDYGFDGRAITIKRLAGPDAAYSDAVTVLKGTVQSLDAPGDAWTELSLRLYDRRLEIDKTLQSNRYAGTTTSAGPTAEGTADLKDQPKPLNYGKTFNVPAVAANPFDLIYQVHDGAVDAIAAYDSGVALTLGSDHADITALQGATIVPGKYDTCLAEGLFRLGGAPFGMVTADVTEGATEADNYAGAVAQRILEKMGLADSSDFDGSTFDALDADAPYEIGIFIDDERTALSALVSVLGSVGAWLAPDNLGVFKTGRLEAPAGSVGTIKMRGALADKVSILRSGDTDGGLPPWRVVLSYKPVWRTQSGSQVVAPVIEERKAFLATEFREVKADDATVKTKHLLSPELPVETLLADADDAASEAARLLALYKVRRDVISFPVAAEKADDYTPGATVTVDWPRFGYSGGRDMVVIGREERWRDEQVVLTLWG